MDVQDLKIHLLDLVLIVLEDHAQLNLAQTFRTLDPPDCGFEKRWLLAALRALGLTPWTLELEVDHPAHGLFVTQPTTLPTASDPIIIELKNKQASIPSPSKIPKKLSNHCVTIRPPK